jgi:hypothetical protein
VPAGLSRQQGQPLLEAGQQRSRRQHLDPGRGQLDGQRQAVEAAADAGDSGRILRGECEAGMRCLCSLDKERHGRHTC